MMVTFKTYFQPEQAYVDAGFLCSMGVDAEVVQEPAYSGALLGATESPYRLEVPESQLGQAAELLKQSRDEAVVPIELVSRIPAAAVDAGRLQLFFRFILIYDSVAYLVFSVFGEHLVGETPEHVRNFEQSLALSEVLWMFVHISYPVLVGLAMLANLMCFFYSSIGRMLFLFTMVWSLLSTLGPPPVVYGPWVGFFGLVQGILAGVALALMYWSPLSVRFESDGGAKGGRRLG